MTLQNSQTSNNSESNDETLLTPQEMESARKLLTAESVRGLTVDDLLKGVEGLGQVGALSLTYSFNLDDGEKSEDSDSPESKPPIAVIAISNPDLADILEDINELIDGYALRRDEMVGGK